jgi:hypothetical protein
MKILYISGPMRGFPRYNFAAFEVACKTLRDAGYTVISPHEIDLHLGFDPDKPLDQQNANFSLTKFLRRDVESIIDADAVVTLPGYENSIGAKMEIGVARFLDKPVYPLHAFTHQ